VVTAGTATTIDVLSAEGEFSGGVILPGEELMRRSLAGNTARLPMADGELVALPRCTMDAITSGCLHAQAGADPQCLLNGGAAERIAPALRIPFLLTDNLVLEGLAAIAENHTPDVGA
jgi:type III pantothenate kinase